MKPSRKHWIAVFLCSFGLTLGLYVAFEYWSMYSSQKRLQQQWLAAERSEPRQTGAPIGTRLQIPKISLDAMIVEGTTRRPLLLGPGHLRTSAQPGEPGNSVVAAHRDTFFRRLAELTVGDDIYVDRGGQQFHFTVVDRKIVTPKDTWVLAGTNDERLTLITCYPIRFIGPAPERLVIISQRVDDKAKLD